MHVTFAYTKTTRPARIVQIDDARIIYRNFSGRGDKYNREGDRNFAVFISEQEIADALINDTNDLGAGWNVKIKPPRDEDDDPFMYLTVKVKFNDYGPRVYLITNGRKVLLDEESISMLDSIDIESVDMDIRAFDDEINGKPFRSAYLQTMYVTQAVDRFSERYPD